MSSLDRVLRALRKEPYDFRQDDIVKFCKDLQASAGKTTEALEADIQDDWRSASADERRFALGQLAREMGEIPLNKVQGFLKEPEIWKVAAGLGLDIDDLEEVPGFRKGLNGGWWNKDAPDDEAEESRRRPPASAPRQR
jgi:hypothetical protein